jgi:hypothetical protein
MRPRPLWPVTLEAKMHSQPIASALITEPVLIAFVLITSLALAVALAIFVIDMLTQIQRNETSLTPAYSREPARRRQALLAARSRKV